VHHLQRHQLHAVHQLPGRLRAQQHRHRLVRQHLRHRQVLAGVGQQRHLRPVLGQLLRLQRRSRQRLHGL
jgi:hypothetical protein